jgi:hypothetical protein
MSKVVLKVPVFAVIEGEGLTEQEIIRLSKKDWSRIESKVRKDFKFNLDDNQFKVGDKTLVFGFLVGIDSIRKRIT